LTNASLKSTGMQWRRRSRLILPTAPLSISSLIFWFEGVVAHLVGHHELDPGGFHCGGHAVTVGQRQRHRLLAEDVLARRRCSQHHRSVAVGLAGDDHRLYVRVVEQVFQVRRVAHAVLWKQRQLPRTSSSSQAATRRTSS
jgi:hypothetical protein